MKNFLILMLTFFAATAFASEGKQQTLILTSDNSLVLDQQVDDQTTAALVQQAMQLDSKLPSGDPLYLVLSSPGGSIQAGLEFIQNMKALNRPIHTITIFAASMGFQIVQGLGTRYVTNYGTLMAHKAYGGFEGEFPGQINSRLTYWLKRLKRIDQDVIARTKGKLNIKQFEDLYENEVWIEGQDTVDIGLADEVVLTRCDQSLIGTREVNVNFMGFGFQIVLSKCPTVLGVLDVRTMIHTDQGVMTLDDFVKKGGKFTPEEPSYYNPYSKPVTEVGPQLPKAPIVSIQLDMKKIEEEKAKIMERFQRKRKVFKE